MMSSNGTNSSWAAQSPCPGVRSRIATSPATGTARGWRPSLLSSMDACLARDLGQRLLLASPSSGDPADGLSSRVSCHHRDRGFWRKPSVLPQALEVTDVPVRFLG